MNGEKTFVWKEHHTNLVNSEIRGFSRRDTYHCAEYEEGVCEKCFRKLKRNSIIVPVVSWFLLFATPICSYYFCSNSPVLQRCLYVIPGLIFLLCLIDRELYYSIIGLLLRPLLGVYNLHPLGESITRNLQKELNIEKKAEKKKGKVIKVLSEKYHISESDASIIIILSGIDDRIQEDKAIQRLSAKKIVDVLIPDKETLNSYLKDLAKYDHNNFIAHDNDVYFKRLNQASKEKRLYGLDVDDILKIMDENY